MNENLYPKRHNTRWRWDGQDGEHLTFQHPKTGSINVLNPIGAMIFNLSDGNHAIKDVIDKIMEEYETPSRDVVANEVYGFVDFMAKSKVVMLLEG